MIYAYYASDSIAVNLWVLADAGLMAIIGVMIWRNSRTAAVAGLLFFILERAWMFQNNGWTP